MPNSPAQQLFCRRLQNEMTRLQAVCQAVQRLEAEAGTRYELRQTLRNAGENAARSLQLLSYAASRACSNCKNL